MASLIRIKGKRGTTWRLDFFLGDDPTRKSIRLGELQKSQATTVKSFIAFLIAAKESGTSPDPEVTRWASERDDTLYAKLEQHGLVKPRTKVAVPLLGTFVDTYIASRSDVKCNTFLGYKQTRRNLLEYFGGTKHLDEITV